MYTYNITNKKTHYEEGKAPWTEYTFEFEFKTREEYLEFRKGWKEEYLVLSKLIRKAKHEIRNTMREQAAGGGTIYYSVWKEFGHVSDLKSRAHMMMQLVEASKREADYQQCKERNEKLEKAS